MTAVAAVRDSSPDVPERLIVVNGTATEIGKTWVACELLRSLRGQGVTVAARKPVQSFDPGASPAVPTDAELLAGATADEAERVCAAHRWYPVAMAPPMAVDALGGRPFTAADLLAELTWPGRVEVGLVETVGGVRSPLADDADSASFTSLLRPDAVLLVADAELGTINAVRLSATALASISPVVYLNRYDDSDDLHRRNRRWLEDRDGYIVVTDVAAALGAL